MLRYIEFSRLVSIYSRIDCSSLQFLTIQSWILAFDVLTNFMELKSRYSELVHNSHDLELQIGILLMINCGWLIKFGLPNKGRSVTNKARELQLKMVFKWMKKTNRCTKRHYSHDEQWKNWFLRGIFSKTVEIFKEHNSIIIRLLHHLAKFDWIKNNWIWRRTCLPIDLFFFSHFAP